MNAQSLVEFRWLSPLGIAVVLFLLSAAIHVLTPIAGLILLHRHGPISPRTSQYFVFSARAEAAWLGKPPAELVEEFPALRRLYLVLVDFTEAFTLGFAISGLLGSACAQGRAGRYGRSLPETSPCWRSIGVWR